MKYRLTQFGNLETVTTNIEVDDILRLKAEVENGSISKESAGGILLSFGIDHSTAKKILS